ncbi:hypothetical protein HMPREF0663_11033 [Hoylesella oralis ATCC 33269]|uniref:Uncharacterized protein n=1 Tax=Hoylesella oralis ATCC 33269 TaxID=873533 RepID=E7RPD2_9BACT|nr:hypothetical protein HMPREF0663_11033 [Hoylesella oralis ATCC 33269]
MKNGTCISHITYFYDRYMFCLSALHGLCMDYVVSVCAGLRQITLF